MQRFHRSSAVWHGSSGDRYTKCRSAKHDAADSLTFVDKTCNCYIAPLDWKTVRAQSARQPIDTKLTVSLRGRLLEEERRARVGGPRQLGSERTQGASSRREISMNELVIQRYALFAHWLVARDHELTEGACPAQLATRQLWWPRQSQLISCRGRHTNLPQKRARDRQKSRSPAVSKLDPPRLYMHRLRSVEHVRQGHPAAHGPKGRKPAGRVARTR